MNLSILQVGIVEQNLLKHIQKNIPKVFPQTESMILKDVMILPSQAYDRGRMHTIPVFCLVSLRNT